MNDKMKLDPEEEWLTTQQIYDTVISPTEGGYKYSAQSLYVLFKTWRDGPPLLLVEGKHWKTVETENGSCPYRVYSLVRVVQLIALHRLSNAVCKSIFPTNHFLRLQNTLVKLYK